MSSSPLTLPNFGIDAPLSWAKGKVKIHRPQTILKKDKGGTEGESAPPDEEVEYISFVAAAGDAPKLDAQLFRHAQQCDEAL